jgi:hypothetical protein
MVLGNLDDQEKYEEALELFQKVYEGRRRILGDDDPG